MLSFELHTNPDGFHRLRDDWEALIEAGEPRNVFLSWPWASTWWRYFGADCEPRILAARRRDNRVVAIAPFVLRERRLPIAMTCRELALLGSTRGSPDHLDVLVEKGYEQVVLPEFARLLFARRQEWDIVGLSGLSSSACILPSLLSWPGPMAQIISRSPCPFLPLPSAWGAYASTLDSKFRYNLRSRLRRLARDTADGARFERVDDPDGISAVLSTLFSLHRERRAETSSLLQPGIWSFHQALAQVMRERGWLRLYSLTVSSAPIAIVYAFRYGEVVYFYQTAFDPRWSRYGPGALVIEYAIRASIEEGAREFDFLRGAEEYKYQWMAQSRDDLRGVLGVSLKGRIIVDAYRVGLLMRRAAHSGRTGRRRTGPESNGH